MTDTFKMSIGEAHELELACRRNNATHEDLKFLSGGKRLARALAFLRGEALPIAPTTFEDPNIMTRDFNCNLALTGMDAINATGRNKYVTDSGVKTMPRATSESGQIHFFKVGKTLNVRQPAQEAAKRGLSLVDPHTLAAFNAANPEFADTHPNATEWDDENGIACYAAFSRWVDDERGVSVRQRGDDWNDDWWFAGFSE